MSGLCRVGGEDFCEKPQAEQCTGLLGSAERGWERQMPWLSENDIPERHFLKENKGMHLEEGEVGRVGLGEVEGGETVVGGVEGGETVVGMQCIRGGGEGERERGREEGPLTPRHWVNGPS